LIWTSKFKFSFRGLCATLLYGEITLWKESLSNDGQQFH